ncbi:ATP synthase subunit I [Aliamphritea ceti]|uniref:ATP synthase subunit I n=1 Tax=Aliamphritea ceti TaxID=1524258 RepID=UPI0021C2E90E|nr:ATP synthase subunit I [Aliamphritea ceti]
MKNQPKKLGIHGRIALEEFRKTLLVQIVCTLIIAALSCTYSLAAGYSAVLGGLIYMLPNIWFIRKMLNAPVKQTAGTVVRQAYASEIWKMAMTAVAFALTFTLIHPVNAFSLFGTYIGLQLVGVYVQLQLNKRFQKL